MAMRKSLAVLLSAFTLMLGMPIVGLAQAPSSTVRGQIVDAGGRGAIGMRVELVSERNVVATTISTGDGFFNFPGIAAGNYVVRTMVNGQPSGVRVSVTAGETAPSALIVLPSVAKASPGVIVALGINGLIAGVVATVSVVANQVFVTQQDGSDKQVVLDSFVAAQQYLVQLSQQVQGPTPPGQAPPPPLFAFIPVTPASGAQ